MADIDLDQLERLHAAATAGPWHVATGDEYEHVDYWQVHGPGDQVAFDDGSAWDEYSRKCSVENRDLLVALRNAFPSLAAELRLLRDAQAGIAEMAAEIRRLSSENAELRAQCPWLLECIEALLARPSNRRTRQAVDQFRDAIRKAKGSP